MIKSTGITRKVDELGRIVIPMELRNKLGIAEKDPLEIFVDGSSIILKKYNPNCIFCGNSKDLLEFNDNLVCTKCQSKIAELKKKEEAPKETQPETNNTNNTNNTNVNNMIPKGFDYSKYLHP